VTDVLGIEAQPGPLQFYPQASRADLLARLPQLGEPKTYAVIHPASRWAFKQWVPEHWAAVADQLHQQHGLTIVFSCGPAERETQLVAQILAAAKSPHLSTQGKLSLHELGLLMKEARLFAGVDTVAMHLAAAVQVPVLALFGPSSEWSWHPWQVPHELALGPCSCKQTRQFICDKSQPYPCMQAITTQEVLQAAARLLQKT
jgi:heptosyltransferase-3